jgi:uncharacterized protein DUF4398
MPTSNGGFVMNRNRLFLVCAALAPLMVVGCASKPPRPEAQLARAEASLVQAEQAGARQYSGRDYDVARDKLSEAKRMADKGETAPAGMLADQARVDAELAAAHSRRMAADKAASEVRLATETLQGETTRQSATTPATP